MGKIRSSKIELLRIFSMMLIIANHYCTYIDFFNTEYTSNKIAKVFLGNWGALGVDIFIIISVWFLADKNAKFSIWKLVSIILATVIYTLGWYFYICMYQNQSISFSEIKSAVLSPFFGTYWFVTAYICFYLLCPLINNLVNTLSDEKLGFSVIVFTISVLLFQVFVPGNPNYGIISTFVFLFLLVAYVKRKSDNFIRKYSGWIALVAYILSAMGMFVAQNYNIERLKTICSEKYSPLTIILALSIFYCFEKRRDFSSSIVNRIAATMFGVYIFHAGPISQKFLSVTIGKGEYWYNKTQLFPVVVVVFVLCVLIVGIIIDLIRTYLLEIWCIKILHKIAFVEKTIDYLDDKWGR